MVDDAVDTASSMADDAQAVAEDMADDAAAKVDDVVASFTGDVAKGKRVFTKCMSCHSIKEGQNRVGPSLYGIIGREAGTVAKFNYSDANKNSGITWTPEILLDYLEDPQGYIPGTRMVFPGLKSEEDRQNVIAYLQEEAK
ncbi:MAG: cytochrome c family protein [Parvularculaceae bacterium]|nr:cytochrome c family protein [Parvularculaceae bacterium]